MTTARLAYALLAVKFQGPAQERLDLSPDEQWVLAIGRRTVDCKARKAKCTTPLLAVYNATTGKQAGSWEGEEDRYVTTARFLTATMIQAVVTTSAPGTALLQWEWQAGTEAQVTPLPPQNRYGPCLLDETGAFPGSLHDLEVLRNAASRRHLFRFDCHHWRHGSAILATNP
jgi:hypothetical protein